MLYVLGLTDPTVNRSELVERDANSSVSGSPDSGSAGTITALPSSNASEPPVMLSSVFGRS